MPQFSNSKEGLRFRIVLRPGFALGPGKADLLQAIDETTSLTAAAGRFGMSEGAVRVALHRAVAAMAALMRNQ